MALADEAGVVAWFSLMTTDVATSNDYYTKLMGWEASEMEIPDLGAATIYAASGERFGGPVPLEADAGVPSHWITYFTVPDVDAACARAKELGGQVCAEPFDMTSIGRSAVITDPAGAVFHPFTPEKTDEDINVMGRSLGLPCWLELTVDDPAQVKDFYAGLLGWDIVERNMGGGPYLIGEVGELMVAGIMQRPENAPPSPPMWLPYFTVESLEASSGKAVELGAQQLFGPMHIEGIGHFSLFQDPTGAVSYLFQGEADSEEG